MNYKTILAIHPTDEPLTNLAPVIALAHKFDSHVDVLIMSAMSAMPPIIAMEVPSQVWSEALTTMTERCEERAQAVRGFFADEGIGVSVTVKAQQTAQVDNAIATTAVYCDLVVMQRNESLVSGIIGQALEGALFEAGKPVLIVDHHTNQAPVTPELAFIAWDGSREAARAVQHSLPLLRNAQYVQVFSIAKSDTTESDKSMRRLSRHLARHNVTLDTRSVPNDGQSTAKALKRYVDEQRPALLVMGAYGHSRLRELVFSGSTRAVLTHDMNTTLLLSH